MASPGDDLGRPEDSGNIATPGSGLPPEARRRLEESQGSRSPFATDLSVDEFLLALGSGYHAAGVVMGSSIYHVGWQRTSYTRGEITTSTRAHLHARELALGRMQEEAAALGAHGVIGVRLTAREYEWGQDLLEFTAVGTAVRLAGARRPERPFLCDLSGEDFWTLLQAGYAPRGVAMGYCAYFVYQSRTLASWSASWQNVEIAEFTAGVYEARRRAMNRMEDDVRRLGADGVVGVRIEPTRKMYRTSDDGPVHLRVDFLAIGTAIAGWAAAAPPTPRPVLNLMGLRPMRSAAERTEFRRD
jgi:uncharacterized protein YbjQ (UPF0145 family)